MSDKANPKDLKNKIRLPQTNASFTLAKDMLPLYKEIGKSICKGPNDRQSLTNIWEVITDLVPESIGKIEENLRLTFDSETGENANVCMANSAEVRNEYKNSFDAKDLLDYIYAVLHSPEYRLQYKNLSKIDVIEVPHPNDQNRFWRLASFGAQLRQLHLLESPTEKEYGIETDKILKSIAKIETE